MSLLGATILTAIATLALAVFAFITAIFAALAFRRQSQDVALLLEQNKRDADQRRRAQATRVFFGTPPDGDSVSPYVKNASDFLEAQVKTVFSFLPPPQKFDAKEAEQRCAELATAIEAFADVARDEITGNVDRH